MAMTATAARTTLGLLDPWSREQPGPMTHPGPRTSRWPAAPAVEPAHGTGSLVAVAALVRETWWSEDFHRRPDGSPSRTRRRPVPSAGALHPVQWHIHVGAGCDLPPGVYAYDGDADRFHRRADATLRTGALVVVTVLPQRTTARYQHRAWPVLVGEAAYAATAFARLAAARALRVRWSRDGAPAASLLGLPEPEDWASDWPGTPVEVPLVVLGVEASVEPDPVALSGPPERSEVARAPQPMLTALLGPWRADTDLVVDRPLTAHDLRTRHSIPVAPDLSGLATATDTARAGVPLTAPGTRVPSAPEEGGRHTFSSSVREELCSRRETSARGLAHACGQPWVGSCPWLLAWSADPARLTVDDVWAVSFAAADAVYDVAAVPGWSSRPVAGWTGRTLDGRIVLHAVAMAPDAPGEM